MRKIITFITGSSFGLLAGIYICFGLKLIGVDFSGLESSLIITTLTAFGMITSSAVS